MGAMGQAAVTPERVMQLAWGYAPPFIMNAALQHGFFDILAEGSKTADETAIAAGVPPRGARAIMNALAGLQLLTKDDEGRFSLAPDAAAFLVRGRPGYLGEALGHFTVGLIPKWLELSEVVRTGKPALSVNQQAPGTEFFLDLVGVIFPMSYPSAQKLAEALGIEEATHPVRVLDLAAGSGVWSIALAQKSPLVTVTAVDWPNVLEVTKKFANRFGLTDRYSYVAGDLLEADFGSGHNVAVLGHILHSEGEQRSRQLLAKTQRALAPGGTIAIGEFLVDDERRSAVQGLFFAVNMLVNTDQGDTYSFHEIASWLRDAGFENPRTVDAPGPSPLILATKV